MAVPCVVTATLNDTGGNNVTTNSYLRFKLRGYQGFVPRILGGAIIVENQLDATPDGSGNISVNIWGNDVIDPTGTFYTVEQWDGGRITSSVNYLIVGSSFNLNTAPILNPPALPPSVTVVTTQGVATSGQGYFLGPGKLYPANSAETTTGILTDVANRVFVSQFILPIAITIRKVSWYVNGLTVGVKFNFGIYSADGAAKLLDAPFTITGTGAAQSVTITPVTLQPGVYWFAQTDSAASTSGPGLASVTNVAVWIANFNANNPHWGYAANAASAGVLPSSLGAITTPATFTGVIAMPVFEP